MWKESYGIDLKQALKKHAKFLSQDENVYVENELVYEESKKKYNMGEEFQKDGILNG
jgi:hypothetical protein